MAEKENKNNQIKEITEKLESGIRDLFNGGEYATYLKLMSRFHNYSTRNTLLIHLQNPYASRVAGFRAWKEKHGRQVKKGEKGMKILAPIASKEKKEMFKIDPETNAVMLDEKGEPVTEEREIVIPRGFRAVTVFDISQTDGEPLPTLAQDITGDVRQYDAFMDALRAVSPLPIEFGNLPPDTDGQCHLGEKIVIRSGMSEIQTVSAVIHEMAHAELHDAVIVLDNGKTGRKTRAVEETEAESVSYVICQYFGIETSANSFGYLAGWSSGRELKELQSSLDTIRKSSAIIIDRIDDKFNEIAKERRIDLKTVIPTQPAAVQENNAAVTVPQRDKETVMRELDDEVAAVMMMFIDNDINKYGGVSENTLETITAQGYEYKDGTLIKAEKQEPQEPPQRDENPTISELNYQKFVELFPKIIDGEYSYLRLEAGDAFMPLSVEWIGDNRISIMHTFEMNGDLCYDPMIVIECDKSAKTLTAVEFQQSLPPLYQQIDNETGIGCSVDGNGNQKEFPGAKLQAELGDFVGQWLENIEQQEYLPVRANMEIDGEEKRIEFDSRGTPILPASEPESVQPDLSMPDPSISQSEMFEYGYAYEDMLPLNRTRALELFDTEFTVYLLYNDESEAMAFERNEIDIHEGIFGIERADWERFQEYKKEHPELFPETSPAVAELEATVNAGEQISVTALSRAVHSQPARIVSKSKPSILGQIEEGKQAIANSDKSQKPEKKRENMEVN